MICIILLSRLDQPQEWNTKRRSRLCTSYIRS